MKNSIHRAIRQVGAAALVFALALSAVAQKSVQESVSGEIRDPFTGIAWQLVRDAEHPGGPARLVRIEPAAHESGQSALRTASRTAKKPVIRSGDRIVIEEHSPVLDAHLEAVALANAVPGQALRARLKYSGAVVMAFAVAPGSALLAMEAKR